MKKHIGIVICSRLKSKRLPNKAHLILEGRTVIGHLVNQLLTTNLPIVVTVPQDEFVDYLSDDTLPRTANVLIHNSEHSEDPLARTYQVAKQFNFDYVIRITHDKIFIDQWALLEALKIALNEKSDYLYTSNLVPGSNFEIISYRCLADAAMKYKNVEYISYAVRNTSLKTINYNVDNNHENIEGINLLLDYEDDFNLYQVIMSRLGPNTYFKQVMNYLSKNRGLVNINKKPLVTIYTCAYNSSEFIDKCMRSVCGQSIFNICEYILIDDFSKDDTFEKMVLFSLENELTNIKYFRNNNNIGLASSSNIALSKARGKYIIRLDSDDYFTDENILQKMIKKIEVSNDEVIYPDNYCGSIDNVQKGKENHHVGGALFNKNALNFIKFTDGLRGYEGYDLYLRAKDRLKIGYYESPGFFYTKRSGSMSASNKSERKQIKREIDSRIKGKH
jgi:spore coat polysaccharide biosynthesis protein SpsF (cytidylyltransferase family)